MDLSKRFPRLVSRRSLIAAGIATLGATAGIAVPLTTQGSFYPGTTVGDVDISEQSMESAKVILSAHFSDFENHALDYVFEDQVWQANLADLGYAIDYDATLQSAYAHGRNDGLIDRYSGLLISTIRASFPVVFTRDEATLTAFLRKIGPEIKGAARDARLYLSENQVKILENRDGRQLDVDQAIEDTTETVRHGIPGTVTLNTMPVVSQVTTEDLAPIRDQTALLISDAVSVHSGNTRWNIPRDMLIEALIFPEDGGLTPPSVNSELLSTGLQGIADEMYSAPVNAIVGWSDGLYAVENDTPGQEVDVDALASSIVEAAATSDQRSIELPLSEVPAAVRTSNLDELGITTFLAEGSSSFSGSSEARAANVRISAEHLNHTLIPPGGNCSFNDSLGPITLDNGFVEGKIIKGDWIESDLGGGACQASTTVFRAALYAGLDFLEWHPHSFRLAFYEADGSPPGIDAAIYQPNNEYEWELDLVFTNTTDNWMLMEMTTEGEVAVTTVYGAPMGFKVDVTVPSISDPIEPGPPLEKVDDTLKKGDRQQTQTAQDGYNVTMHRVVKREGRVVSEQDFISDYIPQRETWLIGPGTKRQFPEDDPEATETAG